MKNLLEQLVAYRTQKGWDKSDNPHNLAKSTFVEAGELLECFLEEQIDLDHVEAELADVLMYALSLATELKLDVSNIITKKWQDVDSRYPDVID